MIKKGKFKKNNTVPMFDFTDCKSVSRELFYEHRDTKRCQPVFTKYANDRIVNGERYFSLRKLYVEIGDPTEHRFVQIVFDGDFQHWEKVKDCLNKYLLTSGSVEDWSKELSLKLKGRAMRAVIDDIDDLDSKSRISSAKWLLEGKWEPKPATRSSANRKKAEIEKENIKRQFSGDLARVQHLFKDK